jgi:twinkle protein
LFGRDKFSGAGKRLIIVEGEIDALSIAKASMDKYKKIYPVVALSSASMAKKSILENREWIRSFQEVILCLDNDEAGQSATDEAIRIIGLDKVKIARLPLKDPNEVLVKLDSSKLLQCIFDSAPYIPSGIITREALWEALVTYNSIPSVPYPTCIGGINTKTKGARLGEIALFVSGTSCGKSTVLREIMLSMQEQTKDKLGVISLEESPAETARKLAGMALKQNPAKEEIPLDTLEIGFDKVFGSDRYMLLDHQGSIKDATIMDKLEYMALSGCKWLFIDHITILVSEGAEGLTGNEAIDKVMNDLLRFVKKYNVWIGLVSHLRKTNNTGKAFEEGEMPNLDDIKGSGSIKQVSFDIIAFARNLMAEDPVERNTIKMAVLKCRYTGLTGFIAPSYYDYDTGRFTEEIPTENFIRIAPPIVVPKSAPKTENYAVIT